MYLFPIPTEGTALVVSKELGICSILCVLFSAVSHLFILFIQKEKKNILSACISLYTARHAHATKMKESIAYNIYQEHNKAYPKGVFKL